MADQQIDVRDNPALDRYEAFVDGDLAGFAVYRLTEGRVVFLHTEVAQRYGGQGVATALARAALDDVRRRRLWTVPLCPFIAGFIRRNPDYGDLVTRDDRAWTLQ